MGSVVRWVQQCDVDVPDMPDRTSRSELDSLPQTTLELILFPRIYEREDFTPGSLVLIDQQPFVNEILERYR